MASVIIEAGSSLIGAELAQQITARGLTLHRVQDGNEAFGIAETGLPDLVIADCNLPGLDGLALYKQLKQKYPTGVSFILVADKANSQERMQALFAGVSAYLEKPVDQELLKKEMAKAFQKKAKGTARVTKKVSFKGNLTSMPISDTFQMIANYQKSGTLRVKSPLCYIHFVKGEIVNAEWKNRSGELALFTIFAYMEGDFEFEEYPPTCERKIDQDWMSLLMDGLRSRDEITDLKTFFNGKIAGEGLDFLIEMIIRGMAGKEDITNVYQNLQPGEALVDVLVKQEFIDVKGITEIRDDLKKAQQPATKSDRITRKFQQKNLAAKIKSQAKKDISDQKVLAGEDPSTPVNKKDDKNEIQKASSSLLMSGKGGTRALRMSSMAMSASASGGKGENIGENIFQRVLLALGLLSSEQINQCVQEQVRAKLQNKDLPLYEIILQQGLLEEETVTNIMGLKNERGENLIPGYEIYEPIGEGGMAAVYLGLEEATDREVAIKIFTPPMSSNTSTTVVRFVRECEVVQSLAHPNIIEAFDFGEFYGLYYIVLEYLRGQTLEEAAINEGAMSEERALEVIEKIVLALYKAWGKGFIHRDIKPANIMIGEGFVKLCDFGLAKALDSDLQLTQAGTVLGTPHYMSPEQIGGTGEVDYRSDVYSLGVTLYAILSAHLPFGGTTQIELSSAHLHTTPPPLSKFHVSISKATEAFVFKLLSKKPSERCKSAEELLENLRRAKKKLMPKGGVSYYIQKRNKRLIKLGIFLFVLLAIGGTVGYNMYQKKEAAKEKARLEKANDQKKAKIAKEAKLAQAKAQKEKLQNENKNTNTVAVQTWKGLKSRLKDVRKENSRLFDSIESMEESYKEMLSGVANSKKSIHSRRFSRANDKLSAVESTFNASKKSKQRKKILRDYTALQEQVTSLMKDLEKEKKSFAKTVDKYGDFPEVTKSAEKILQDFGKLKEKIEEFENTKLATLGKMAQKLTLYSNTESITNLSEVLMTFSNLQENVTKQDISSAKDQMESLSKNSEFRAVFYKEMTSFMKKSPHKFKLKLLKGWMKLGTEASKKLAFLLGEEQEEAWVMATLLPLSDRESKKIASYLVKSSPEARDFAGKYSQFRKVYYLFKDLPQSASALNTMLNGNYAKLFKQVYGAFSVEDQQNIVESLPKISRTLTTDNLLSFVAFLVKVGGSTKVELVDAVSKISSSKGLDCLDIILRKEDDWKIRLKVVNELGRRSSYTYLLRAFSDNHEKIRVAVIGYAKKDKNDSTISILLKGLKDGSVEVLRASVLMAKSFKEPRSLPLLAKLLSHSYTSVAEASAITLGIIASSESVTPLLDAVNNVQNSSVVQQSVVALGKIGTSKAMAGLLPVYLAKRSARKNIDIVLKKNANISVSLLIRAIRNSDSKNEQKRYLGALKNIGSPSVRPMCSLLDNSYESPSLQKMLIKFLGEIGDSSARSTLNGFLRNRKFKRYAKKALKKLR